MAGTLLDALPHPVLLIDVDGHVIDANTAAETFFQATTNELRPHPLAHIVPIGSPLLALFYQVRERGGAVN